MITGLVDGVLDLIDVAGGEVGQIKLAVSVFAKGTDSVSSFGYKLRLPLVGLLLGHIKLSTAKVAVEISAV